MADTRIEHDTLGDVEVPSDRLWGAQTERAVRNFPIGGATVRLGRPVIQALGLVKRAAAEVNGELGVLDPGLASTIATAATEVAAGTLDDHFPLGAFQSGSGTQSNMNANEVIANRANELAGGTRGEYRPIHPNDHVNRGQSSNDVIPTAMHLATLLALREELHPAVAVLRTTLAGKAREFADIVSLGRTHLQDATPITLGQVVSGWVAQLDEADAGLRAIEVPLSRLAIGGTALGTGVNTHPEFGARVCARLAEFTGLALAPAPNRVAAISAHDTMVAASGALRVLAGALYKLANDVRLYASGPRGGIGELILPANEPGSSIMPGKVNPTQCEALAMATIAVSGLDHTVALAGRDSFFQLNTAKPLILASILAEIALLAEGCRSFEAGVIQGLGVDGARVKNHLDRSLMLVTAVAPHIGYEAAARIAQTAWQRGTPPREAAAELGIMSGDDWDRLVDPAAMTGQGDVDRNRE